MGLQLDIYFGDPREDGGSDDVLSVLFEDIDDPSDYDEDDDPDYDYLDRDDWDEDEDDWDNDDEDDWDVDDYAYDE